MAVSTLISLVVCAALGACSPWGINEIGFYSVTCPLAFVISVTIERLG